MPPEEPREPAATVHPRSRREVDYAAILLRHVGSIVAATLVGALLGLGLSLVLPPVHTATARLFFSVQSGDTAADLNAGSTFAERQLTSYARLAREPLVLDAVRGQLGLNESLADLQKRVGTRVEPDTVMLSISVDGPSPDASAQVANAIANQLATTVAELTPKRGGEDTVRATVTTAAVPPERPSFPNPVLFTLGGALAGLVLASASWVAKEALNTRIRSGDDLALVTDLPVLGEVPNTKDAAAGLVVSSGRDSAWAETIRAVYTKLRFTARHRDRGNVVLITSSLAGEGKSTLSANVAAAMAEAGQRTLLVDADLRRPRLASLLALEPAVGLTSVLLGDARTPEVTQGTAGSALHILASGPIPPNVPELLGSADMGRFIRDAAARYEFVVIDTPPVLPVADTLTLAQFADAVVVVVDGQSTGSTAVRRALDALESVQAKLAGIVVNKANVRAGGHYGDYSYTARPAANRTPRPVGRR